MRDDTTAPSGVRRDHQPPNAIHLPAEMPPPPEPLATDAEPIATAEQISKNELRLFAEANKGAPAPEQPLDSMPLAKPSLVAPVQVNGKVLLGFLDCLWSITRAATVPILRNVRLRYRQGGLMLEASDQRFWARVSLEAMGGGDGFDCILPLGRARNVLRRLEERCGTISIGLDHSSIHLGPYSFPHGGSIRDFPAPPPFLPEQLKVALPAAYIQSILERLTPAVATVTNDQPGLRGIYLDFNHGVAVASDGHRLHRLLLRELKMATRTPYRVSPSVTLPLEYFRFLRAVINRDWVGLIVNQSMVTSAGHDYAILATPLEQGFTRWREAIPDYVGFWVADREALLQAIRDTQTVGAAEVMLAVDTIGEKLLVQARGDGAAYTTTLSARRRGGAAAVRTTLAARYLRDALEAITGGIVRLGFHQDDADSAITVCGEDDEFLAVIAPVKIR